MAERRLFTVSREKNLKRFLRSWAQTVSRRLSTSVNASKWAWSTSICSRMQETFKPYTDYLHGNSNQYWISAKKIHQFPT
jgi:hypothetical protein